MSTRYLIGETQTGALLCHTIDEEATAALHESDIESDLCVTFCGHSYGSTLLDASQGDACPACAP